MRTIPPYRPAAPGRALPVASLALAAVLSACGMKGDLYLPPPPATPAPSGAARGAQPAPPAEATPEPGARAPSP